MTKAEAWKALPLEMQADLRTLLADPMLDASKGVTLMQGGVVTWGEAYREDCATFQADPWNLVMARSKR